MLSVCKREECALQAPPACSAHRQLSVKKTKCCDVFECACNCQNSTRTCPAGFIISSSTNDCGCTETNCLPDKVSVCLDASVSIFVLFLFKLSCFHYRVSLQVCVVGGVVHPVGNEWEEGCEKCSCTQLQDRDTSLHIAQCTPPVCDRTCPRVRHAHANNKHTHLHYASITVHSYIFFIHFRAPRILHQKESAVGSAHQPAVWNRRGRCEGTH